MLTAASNTAPTAPLRFSDLADDQLTACDAAGNSARAASLRGDTDETAAHRAYWWAFAAELATYLPPHDQAGEVPRFVNGLRDTLRGHVGDLDRQDPPILPVSNDAAATNPRCATRGWHTQSYVDLARQGG